MRIKSAKIEAVQTFRTAFGLVIILKDIENIQALIAHFDCFGSIGLKELEQMMFHLSIKDKNDLHYFEKYLKASNN